LPCLFTACVAVLALNRSFCEPLPFTIQAAVTQTQFAEKAVSTGASRPVPSIPSSHDTYLESIAAPNGGDFGGGYIRSEGLATNTGFRVAFSRMSLANANVPGKSATLHSEAIVVATNAEDPIGFPVSTLDYGVWAGIHGYLDTPPAPGAAPGGFVTLNLTSGNDTGFADGDYNMWYYNPDPVHIACDFTDGPGTFVHASNFTSFQYLNAERTEFVAFGLSRLPATAINGITGIEQHMILDVAVGPGTHIEMLAPPAGNVLPAFGGGLGWPQSAPVPEPGSLLLLSTVPFGLMLARGRRKIV
jgi:hypothetical protein